MRSRIRFRSTTDHRADAPLSHAFFEAGVWDTSKIEKHWKVGAKQEDNLSQGNIQFTKPKLN